MGQSVRFLDYIVICRRLKIDNSKAGVSENM